MKTEQTNRGTLVTWTVEEVAEAFERNEITMVDVRTPQEYMLERVPGALLMPMSESDPAKLPEGSPKRLMFHCGSGARSEKIARRAPEAGLAPVAHMEGGFTRRKDVHRDRPVDRRAEAGRRRIMIGSGVEPKNPAGRIAAP